MSYFKLRKRWLVVSLALFCALAVYNCDGGGSGGTRSVNVNQEGRFSVEIEASNPSVAPGEEFNLLVKVTSHYSLGMSIRMQITRCPESFICPDIDPGPNDGFTLRAHDTKTLNLTFSSQPDTPAGRYTIGVKGSKYIGSAGGTPPSDSDSAVIEVGPIDENEAPRIIITSPLNKSDVAGRTLVIQGTASDADGVRRVVVNGHAVNSSDGFANWSIKLPLNSGPNSFVVSTTDALNFSNMEAAKLSVYNTLAFLSNPVDMVIDESRQQLLVTDAETNSVVAFDLATGTSKILSGHNKPDDANPLILPTLLAIDSTGSTAWVLDGDYDGLVAIDLESGERSLVPIRNRNLSITAVGSASDRPFHFPLDMIFNPGDDNILVLVQVLNPTSGQGSDGPIMANRIISVNPNTGVRKIFADEHTPSEDFPVYETTRLAFDSLSNTIIATSKKSSSGVYEIDPITGERAVFLQGVGISAEDIELDADHARILIVSNGQLNVLDMVDREFSMLWGSSFYYGASRIAVDRLNNRLLVLFFGNADIGSVDLLTGEESILFKGK